ncbi:PAS domain-containing protein [Hasllibacter halocynthiae]|uniref:PAS domain-containing protein n=1 Tax=Hasllibacter halocynthiae TaxID=595589 RepID=A0A2T0X877_9RHOB|nr:PAS domain-containing protein [Hasllibacter halocynthiae]PRY95127.1 PAS domain-containing protein [Hasllibacter halocynthiae]
MDGQDDRVVPLRPPSGGGMFGPCDEVLAYWEGLRRGRMMPLRSEIDPRGLLGALDQTFILERITGSLARIRLGGLHLVEAMGMEVRGLPFTALFAPEERRALGGAVDAVFAGPERLDLDVLRDGFGPARMILAPLRSDLGDATRAIGCLVAPGGAADAPTRLRLRGVARTDLFTGERRHDLGASFAEIPPEAGARPPKLTLVKD